ncbi:hypothetical protein D9M72_363460 [compost metagenome]
MHHINNQKSDSYVRKMLDQKADCVSRAICTIRQITTCAVNRHKRNQCQKSDERPDDLVSFKIVYKLFHNSLSFTCNLLS